MWFVISLQNIHWNLSFPNEFRRFFGLEPLLKFFIYNAIHWNLVETGSTCDKPRAGRPHIEQEEETIIGAAFIMSLMKSLKKLSAKFVIPKNTVQRIFHRDLELRPHHLQMLPEMISDEYDRTNERGEILFIN